MTLKNEFIVRRVRDSQRGQSLVMIPIMLVLLLASAALVVDMGGLYSSYQNLRAATQAAALAGAQALPESNATAVATNYSAVAGGLNTHPNLLNVTMVSGYPVTKCLTSTGVPCSAPANANAIVVKQQATVQTYFAKLFGVRSLTITATATASAPGPGGRNAPFNVMMVLDTTDSMSNGDPSCGGQSRIDCAVEGLRTMLGTLSPCAAGLASCGTATNGNVQNPVDEVGLMAFPGLSSSTYAQYDYDCSNYVPRDFISKYTSPTLPTYQIVPFSSDYRTSDTAGSLNTASNLVKAARGGAFGCRQGIHVAGGVGTFYAGAVAAAQAALVSVQTTRLSTRNVHSTNVLILLSDGDANATKSNLSGYPNTQECHQAITEAQNAARAGTWVYAIAYGADSSGCSTDTSPRISTCATMQNVASSPNAIPDASKFFSDGGHCPSSRPTTGLKQIFTAIAGDLTLARLIPNDTT
jgi:Flp pilus assembly protein TadG